VLVNHLTEVFGFEEEKGQLRNGCTVRDRSADVGRKVEGRHSSNPFLGHHESPQTLRTKQNYSILYSQEGRVDWQYKTIHIYVPRYRS
jgi:hypothetical protein